MGLQLGRAIGDGIKRVLTRTGGLLLLALIAIQLVAQTSINTAIIGLFPPGPASELEAMLGMTLPVSPTVAGLLFAVTIVLSAAYFVVLSRALTRPKGELSTFPSPLYTRRMGRATLSMLVGGIIVGFSVMIGFAFLFVPGIFLAICFLFFIFAVGVEDRGILDALKRSWGLSRGNRLKLAVLVILAGIIGAIIGVVGTVADMAGTPLVSELLSNALSSVLYVFLYGIIASAYLQVRDEASGGLDGSETTESLGSIDTAD